jgi:hypothetical protein
MAEYVNAPLQTIAVNGSAVFENDPIPCTNGYVVHREGSGIFTLRGVTNQCRARYRVFFGGNIGLPAGGTAGAISIALAIEGEALGGSTAIVTPAAVGEFFNVAVAAYIDVPRGCCVSVSVRNTSDQPIDLQNANLMVERVC